MIEGNLNTTNLLLGIMAAVSVLEALLLIAVGVMAFKLYRQTLETVREIEQRQVAPLAAKLRAKPHACTARSPHHHRSRWPGNRNGGRVFRHLSRGENVAVKMILENLVEPRGEEKAIQRDRIIV